MSTERQSPRAAGLTHASSVMPVVRLRTALCATVTQLLEPLNVRALPNFPALFQVAPVIDPALPFPDESATAVPLPSSKLYEATGPVWAPAAAGYSWTNTRIATAI